MLLAILVPCVGKLILITITRLAGGRTLNYLYHIGESDEFVLISLSSAVIVYNACVTGLIETHYGCKGKFQPSNLFDTFSLDPKCLLW